MMILILFNDVWSSPPKPVTKSWFGCPGSLATKQTKNKKEKRGPQRTTPIFNHLQLGQFSYKPDTNKCPLIASYPTI